MYLERYSSVILGILMYGAVDKIKLGKILCPNWRHILSQTKNIYSPRYCGRYHSSAFFFLISVYIGTRT